jgi:hypothetical protein
VTPAVLNKEAVLELCEFLTGKVNPTFRLMSALFSKESAISNFFGSWRSFLIRNTPWTEYSLYYTFLEGMMLIDKYHKKKGSNAIYDRECSLWLPEQSSSWCFERTLDSGAYFIVVQSTAEIPVDEIWNRVHRFLD